MRLDNYKRSKLGSLVITLIFFITGNIFVQTASNNKGNQYQRPALGQNVSF